MKNSTINKLIAGVGAVALCVPMLMVNPVAANAAVSSNVPVSGNVASSVSGNGSSASEENGTSEVIEPGNVVLSIAGRIKSKVDGIYTARTVKGVAITSTAAEVAEAAGLTDADVAAGTKVKAYVCDSRDKEAKKALAAYAAENGKTVVATINVDLYSITKKGVVTAVKTTAKPVSLTIGLPGRVAKEGNSFSIIAIDENGKVVVMNDVDADAATLTVNASSFGVYAIVY